MSVSERFDTQPLPDGRGSEIGMLPDGGCVSEQSRAAALLEVIRLTPGESGSRLRRCRRLIVAILVCTLAIAALVRFAGLGFGRGVLTARPDEELLRSGVLISLTGDLNPHYAVWGHLFHYLYLAITAGWLAVEVGSGQFTSWTEAVAAAHSEPWTMIWIGRAISATVGVLTVIATYALARRSLRSRLSAVSAAIVLSTLFLHVRDSHFATADMLLTLLSTAALAALATPGRLGAGWAGLWTGLALATKLLSVTVVLTALTLLALGRHDGADGTIRARLRASLLFLLTAAAVALVTQPFLVLDPMETWFGLFGDLFNPERRPFAGGVHLRNVAIVAQYYVPQATGWLVGGLAVLGGVLLLRRWRSRPVATLLVYVFWSLLALFSVDRIFLRYLDPLLPVACVLAGHGVVQLVRWTSRAVAASSRAAARRRLSITWITVVAVACPNLTRDVLLVQRLQVEDTRALAGRWIEQNVPPGSRIVWCGYGSIAAHLTMPWLETTDAYDRQQIAARAARSLPTDVDEAIVARKRARQVPAFQLVAMSFGTDGPARSGIDAFPFLDHHYDLPLLTEVDRWSRGAGLLRRESPRWELMRRHVSEVVEVSASSLLDGGDDFVVLTGTPCNQAIVRRLREYFHEVQVFEPGVPWTDFGGSVMYDLGDAWYLPNQGIHRVSRPGPEIRIFKRKPERPRPQPAV